ncbi:hypothetical protein BT96DRAFT_917494 [Gymnopus androsaceus JB14]|uniref:F-box domain-containing protein n=1 Tax=Gymnopus androsaceus JB14 TaxID=1447944 RepID=A0A6A4I083_9AGAR|nr:hypothetical protein BT96DRAFT_917494 [Gymnopus androsaceus JB14]
MEGCSTATGFLHLSDDVIEEILKYSTSNSMLLSTILVAKSIYLIFQTHPRSILHSLYFYVLGPTFPQALELYNYRAFSEKKGGAIAQVAPEIDIILTARERKSIELMERRVTRLENIFSFRHIDRTSVFRRLQRQESTRFRRAVYRIMFYNCDFPVNKYPFVEEVDRDPQKEIHELREERLKRRAFFSNFSTQELLEIYTISVFLENLAHSSFKDLYDGRALDDITSLALAAGPETILRCHRSQSDDPIYDVIEELVDKLEYHPLLKDYLSYPLLKVLDEREVGPPAQGLTFWHSISTRVTGNNELCHRCNQELGFLTWTRKTWTPLSTIYGPRSRRYSAKSLHDFFPRSLWENKVESVFLRKTLEAHPDNDYLTKIMDDIYDCNLKQENYASWSRDEFLCNDCFDRFLGEHLWIWLRYVKASTGELNEDCPRGYDCEIPIEKHREQFNHLCERQSGLGAVSQEV